jgi:hypothetical protein
VRAAAQEEGVVGRGNVLEELLRLLLVGLGHRRHSLQFGLLVISLSGQE